MLSQSGVQSFDSDGMGSIPAIPDARNVPLLLCHERFNEASLPGVEYVAYDKLLHRSPRFPIQHTLISGQQVVQQRDANWSAKATS